MMEYLLSLPAVHWQLGPGRVLIVRGGRYGPAELERNMGMVQGFLERVPAYVRQELTNQDAAGALRERAGGEGV